MTWLYLGGTPEIFYTIPKCEIFLFISELMNVLEVYNMWVLDTVYRAEILLYIQNSITCVQSTYEKCIYRERQTKNITI